MRRLLWIGDAACDSGFARATHKTLDVLRHEWDVRVIGLNYRGDPHDYPYKIYPAYIPGGDLFGTRRVIPICQQFAPDVVVIQNDPWNIPKYLEYLNQFATKPVVIGALAVDGKNLRAAEYLNGLDHCIFWTRFAAEEALAGGLTKPYDVVPLGVDLNVYAPGDQQAARRALGWENLKNETHGRVPDDAFVFLNVNRNQPRKRLDLTFEYFAELYHAGASNAYLYMHVAPTGDVGWDCKQLTRYYGLQGHVILVDLGAYNNESTTETELANTYRAANTLITTTQGEGFGLTTLEAMASRLACVFPAWSGLGDWAIDGGMPVPCDHHMMTPNGRCNVVGATPAKAQFVAAMSLLYHERGARELYAAKGLALAQRPEYRWEHIGRAFADVVTRAYDCTLLGLEA